MNKKHYKIKVELVRGGEFEFEQIAWNMEDAKTICRLDSSIKRIISIALVKKGQNHGPRS